MVKSDKPVEKNLIASRTVTIPLNEFRMYQDALLQRNAIAEKVNNTLNIPSSDHDIPDLFIKGFCFVILEILNRKSRTEDGDSN